MKTINITTKRIIEEISFLFKEILKALKYDILSGYF